MLIHRLGGKVNFVDVNNVLVGFDTDQDCCEHARWWLSLADDGRASENTCEEKDHDLTPYAFDPAWVNTQRESVRDDSCEDGWISFRLIADGKPDLYLFLANAHNGYYGHGFTVEIGGQGIWGGSL